MDTVAARNAFGRQVRSFEADVELEGVGTMHAIFIRAPWITSHGPDVEVLAEVDGHVIAARQGNRIVVAFHPELTGDDRLHALFLAGIRSAS